MSQQYLKKMQRNVIAISEGHPDQLEDTKFWLTRKPIERLIALEILRQRISNYDNLTSRLQRVFTITTRP